MGHDASINWFNVGGRSWDTAITYESEVGVADAILKVTDHWRKTPRDEIWIGSKIGPWATMGYDETMEQIDTILDQFHTDHVDLLLVHWPAGIVETQLIHSQNSETIPNSR